MVRTRKVNLVDAQERLVLLEMNPERYATTGLDWGNPNHRKDIANGLFQTLMGNLARQQGVVCHPERDALRLKQMRIEQRLAVAERALYREGQHFPRRAEDAVVIYALEKMADSLEDGASAWTHSREHKASNVLAGTMLGVAVGMAAAVRDDEALGRFSIGPFGGLSKIGSLVTRPDVLVEMEDFPALVALVEQARRIPVGQGVSHVSGPSIEFHRLHDALLKTMQRREQGRDCTS